MDNEITLQITRDLILKLWKLVPESDSFGEVETIQQCSQQPDQFMVCRGKKSVIFSVRSFKTLGEPNKVQDWRAID